MIKPRKLQHGDTIATISPSWGIAGETDVLWRYEIGKKRLQDIFGLIVINAPNSLRGERYLKDNPKSRAEDLMWAFENKEVKAIVSNIGGNDSISLLPFINIETIKCNPKIFLGYSDILNVHMMCYIAGLTSFYGANLLPIIAELNELHPYTKHWLEKSLFENDIIGEIPPSENWSCDEVDYFHDPRMKTFHPNDGYELICGTGIVNGKLIGGTSELKNLVETELEISLSSYDDAILFIEDIVECLTPEDFADFVRWLGNSGILSRINGMIIGKFNIYPENRKYIEIIKNVVQIEFELTNLPILYGLNFGHTSPMIVLPYGINSQIDCDCCKFSIIESAVV